MLKDDIRDCVNHNDKTCKMLSQNYATQSVSIHRDAYKIYMLENPRKVNLMHIPPPSFSKTKKSVSHNKTLFHIFFSRVLYVLCLATLLYTFDFQG